MRILHITTEFPPVIFGGLGTAVGGLVYALADAGLEVGVLLVGGVLLSAGRNVSYYGGYNSTGNNQNIETDNAGGKISFFQINSHDNIHRAVDIVNEWAPDAIHFHTAMVWPVMDYIRRYVSIPMVYTVHSVDIAEYEIGNEPSHILTHNDEQGIAIRNADSIICISKNEAELVYHYYPHAKHKVSIIGNGIENIDFERKKERYFSNPVTVLYSGRLVMRKGITDLMEAIPAIMKKFPNTKFVFAGGPPCYTGEQVKQQWLPPSCYEFLNQIHFTGWLKSKELLPWYQRADIQVMPSRYEPFGMVLLEGMLHGLPIIASDVGGPKDILRDYENGLLFPPRDIEHLAERIIELIENPTIRFKIGTSAYRDVRENWLWKKMTGKFQYVYQQLHTKNLPIKTG